MRTIYDNYLFKGIKVTLDSMPENGVILVFTDAGSHQLGLENVIKEKMEKKNLNKKGQIFFSLFVFQFVSDCPGYYGF